MNKKEKIHLCNFIMGFVATVSNMIIAIVSDVYSYWWSTIIAMVAIGLCIGLTLYNYEKFINEGDTKNDNT